MSIAKDIYAYYERYLKENNLIDFDDMINQSTEYIKSGKWFKDYKYIIIDEYQDISISRYKLVKALVDQSAAKILCVGDDWQSIYRFTGSDINLFKDFGEYFGYYELMKIEKNYRNSQDLINIAGSFVMENPLQLKKDLKSDSFSLYPVIIYGYEEKLSVAAIRAIQDIVDRCGDQTDILLLGRNNFDINALQDTPEFTIKNSRNGSVKDIICNYYPNLKISFLTAHRSKGLEATNVIIINTRNAITGFPNQMADDDVLSYVLAKPENYPYAEERRLFYVVMTRTKDTTYILTPEKKPSTFVKELVEKQQIPIRYNNINNDTRENPECPYCGGKLMISKSIHGRFVRCSNFPVCEYTNNHTEIISRPITCPHCGDYLVKRKGPYGPYYGCSTFGKTGCKGKQKIDY